ncbi:hypothetical protein Tco_1033612 [Tanacetum coccineum]
MKKSSTSSSNTQNLAFLSSENTNSTNEVSIVNGDFGVSAAGGINQVPTTPSAHDIAYSFLAKPTTYLEEIKEEDLLVTMAGTMLQTTESNHLMHILRPNQMSARDKTSLGYSTKLNDLSSNHETDSKNSFSVFDSRSSDEDSTPANDMSSQAEGYKAVPPHITGNFLTLRADISFAGLDEYAIRTKIIESQISELNTKTSKTADQTNDEKPKSPSESVVSNPKINRNTVIIEDWHSDDEEEESEVQKSYRPETPIHLRLDDDRIDGQNSRNNIGSRKVKMGLEIEGKLLGSCVQRQWIIHAQERQSRDLVKGSCSGG